MIKVHLLVGKLPFYKDLLNYPPVGVRYLNKAEYGKDIDSYYSSFFHLIKREASSFLLNKLKLPRMTYIAKVKCDLIHSSRGILILNKVPWVIDIDYVGYFFGENIMKPKSLSNSFLKYLVGSFLSSTYCKRVICWSNAAKSSVEGVFKDRKIKDKLSVLYPAVPALKLEKKSHGDKIRLLHVSSSFNKGCEKLLSAFYFLIKRYDNLELVVKCDVPENMKRRYSSDKIKYFPYKSELLPRDELIKKFYTNSDIFVYPTQGDLFGLGLLDAMIASLPIVSTKTFAIPEIVSDNKGGFLLNPIYMWHNDNYLPRTKVKVIRSNEDFVKELVEKTSILIENSSLRKRMGRYNRKLVEKGKFSIEKRNQKLKSIYEGALKF